MYVKVVQNVYEDSTTTMRCMARMVGIIDCFKVRMKLHHRSTLLITDCFKTKVRLHKKSTPSPS